MRKGFTLSEILITLGIVGVVAVLTVPSVMKNYRNRMYVAQLQKVYSQISDAAQAIMNDDHVDNFYETSAISQGVGYFLNNYFKNIKTNCGVGTNLCVGANYTNLNGTSVGGIVGTCVQTVNGAAICGSYTSTNKVFSIFVDVNGAAEPNIAGRDVFAMDIKQDASMSDYGSGSNVPGTAGLGAANCGSGTDNIFSAAAGCVTAVIEAGWKMEY
ncbi:MAG: type II secretion system GspH family protein [Muribaculaceae bacterium]|nr:type II secretion system GspH family protein [Muribaculaceae bacterium]